MTAIDRLAIECAKRLAARQPRADYTIPQLPSLPNPVSTDVLPIYHGSSGNVLGNVYSVTVAALAAALGVIIGAGKTQLGFREADVGAGNTNAAVVDRIPLAANVTITNVAVVGAAITAGCTFNIVSGEGADVVNSPLNVFPTDQALPLAGVVQTYAVPGVFFAVGTELTLRIATPGGGGVGGVKVTFSAVLS